jgi:hypothetical protein
MDIEPRVSVRERSGMIPVMRRLAVKELIFGDRDFAYELAETVRTLKGAVYVPRSDGPFRTPPPTKDAQWCRGCKQYHPWADFTLDASTDTGYSRLCRACTRARNARTYARARKRKLAEQQTEEQIMA